MTKCKSRPMKMETVIYNDGCVTFKVVLVMDCIYRTAPGNLPVTRNLPVAYYT